MNETIFGKTHNVRAVKNHIQIISIWILNSARGFFSLVDRGEQKQIKIAPFQRKRMHLCVEYNNNNNNNIRQNGYSVGENGVRKNLKTAGGVTLITPTTSTSAATTVCGTADWSLSVYKGGGMLEQPPSSCSSSSPPGGAAQQDLWWTERLVVEAQQEFPGELGTINVCISFFYLTIIRVY